jgi:hypothetical protein
MESHDARPIHLIRARLAAGTLPTIPPERLARQQGDGRPCNGCDAPVERIHIQYELDFRDNRAIRFHADCLVEWQRETALQVAQGRRPLTSVPSRATPEADDTATLTLHTIRSVNPGITARDLAEWFRGGTVCMPRWARHTLGPLLAKAGIDETKPIYLRSRADGHSVTLYQPSAAHRSLAANASK